MKRWRLGVVTVACLASAPAHLSAQSDPTPTDAASSLVAVQSADPLELARVVDREGDRAVLALLADGARTEARLAALRASPWLRQPEAALAALCTLLAARDPELAEAAARALEQIASRLTVDRAQRSEVSAELLSTAADALVAVAGRPELRHDLRLSALAVAHQLALVANALEPAQP